MKAIIKSIVGERDASFEGQDGKKISGKTITCTVECDGKAGKMPITAYGKLADKIVPGAEVNVTKRVDKKGNSIFTAKKEDNAHLLPDQKPWNGGKGGGGMSESDVLFIAACAMCGGDPAGFDQAMEEAKALRAHSKGSSGTTVDTTDSQEDDNVPF